MTLNRNPAVPGDRDIRTAAPVAASQSWVGYVAAAWAILFALPSFYWAAGGSFGIGTIAADPDEFLGTAKESSRASGDRPTQER